jgi:hypothetical protein
VEKSPGIYVETLIRADIDELWRRTQDPAEHERWDLRFTRIEYLPRPSPDEPQRFHYSTRIGFGLGISGMGESTGTRDNETGTRTSALRFWSADWKSLIEEGSGYWKYEVVDGGVRFFTWYDYRTRFGPLGNFADRLCFRPLMGWATAWSFDRLRLWLESGVAPESSASAALIHAIARVTIAFVWLWHGLVPKLLYPSPDEIEMLRAASMPSELLPLIGLGEVALGSLALAAWRWRPFFVGNAILMLAAAASVAIQSPQYLIAAFNPVSLNAAVIAISIAGYLASARIPSASRCLRQAPRREL